MKIHVNSVLSRIAQDVSLPLPALVLWVQEDADIVVAISLESAPRRPWTIGLKLLREFLADGKIVVDRIRLPSFMMALEDEISEKDRTRRDTNWDRIKPIVQGAYPGHIFEDDVLGQMIRSRSAKIGVQKKTLYRLVYRYWMFGSTRNALLPNFEKSGGTGVEKKYENGKRPGRPPKEIGITPRVNAKILSEQDKTAIRIGYALYAKDTVKSKADAYEGMLRKFYCEEITHPSFPEANLKLKALSELPTRRQFEYWGRKSFDEMTVLRGRKGEIRWAKDHRALKGRAADGLFGPGHRFEIDATIADIYLISRFNRNWIIGRPVVYVVVDVFSRMIVGLFVGLEGPSWNGARQALLNTFNDKQKFCAEYGIRISQEEWPSSHLPQELSCDRGEMLGLAAESIVPSLGIDLVIAPPYRPDWKSIVESRFRILDDLTQIQWRPGGVTQRIKERGQRDYREDATLTLREFTEIMIASVLHYNHHARYPQLLSPAMAEENIQPTPISMWNWGIEHGFATRVDRAPDLVNLQLLSSGSGVVQAGGISFAGMLFHPEEIDFEKEFSYARAKGRRAIDIWHDPTKPSQIWIRGNDKQLVRCVWRSESKYGAESRLEEILDMQIIVSQTDQADLHRQLESKVNLDNRIASIIETASAEKKEAPAPKSKSEQIANIRTNRAIERASAGHTGAQRGIQGEREKPANNSHANSGFGERSAEVINILSQLRRKGPSA